MCVFVFSFIIIIFWSFAYERSAKFCVARYFVQLVLCVDFPFRNSWEVKACSVWGRGEGV